MLKGNCIGLNLNLHKKEKSVGEVINEGKTKSYFLFDLKNTCLLKVPTVTICWVIIGYG